VLRRFAQTQPSGGKKVILPQSGRLQKFGRYPFFSSLSSSFSLSTPSFPPRPCPRSFSPPSPPFCTPFPSLPPPFLTSLLSPLTSQVLCVSTPFPWPPPPAPPPPPPPSSLLPTRTPTSFPLPLFPYSFHTFFPSLSLIPLFSPPVIPPPTLASLLFALPLLCVPSSETPFFGSVPPLPIYLSFSEILPIFFPIFFRFLDSLRSLLSPY